MAVSLETRHGTMAPRVYYSMRCMRTRTKNLKNEKPARIFRAAHRNRTSRLGRTRTTGAVPVPF